jgi:hypothetical protein
LRNAPSISCSRPRGRAAQSTWTGRREARLAKSHPCRSRRLSGTRSRGRRRAPRARRGLKQWHDDLLRTNDVFSYSLRCLLCSGLPLRVDQDAKRLRENRQRYVAEEVRFSRPELPDRQLLPSPVGFVDSQSSAAQPLRTRYREAAQRTGRVFRNDA